MELRGRALPFTSLLAWAAVAGAADATCSCDCCLAGVNDNGLSEVAECHVQLPGFVVSAAEAADAACGVEFCAVPAEAKDLDAASVDYSRFCADECVPAEIRRGALCQRAKVSVLRAAAGKALRGAPHPVLSAGPKAAEPQTLVRTRAFVARQVASPAMPSADWPSLQGDPHDVGARVEDLNNDVQSRYGMAKESSELATKVQVDSQNQLPTVEEANEQSKGSAEVASMSSLVAPRVLAEASQGAKEAAESVEKDTLAALEKDAHKTAKKEAKEAADKLEKEMKAAIPAAKAAAEKPFKEAMARAAAVSGDYAKAGDGLSGLSLTDQLNAQMMLSTANQFNALGSTSKAQGLQRDATNLMGQASGEADKAQGMYDTAGKIMGTVGGYMNEIAAAGYNAEVMLNPEAYPPAPPIV